MISRISSDLVWTKTQTPSRTITPASEGYSLNFLRLRQHVYLLRNDSITHVLRFDKEEDDWKQHRVFLRYLTGERQVVRFVYDANDNRRDLLEVITSPLYTGEYNPSADTVNIHYRQAGAIDRKYRDDEDKRLLK